MKIPPLHSALAYSFPIVCGLLAVPILAAVPGQLDTTFGDRGRVVTAFPANASAYAVSIQTDGKIIVAGYVFDEPAIDANGDFALARYNRDGTLDTTFGDHGKVSTDFGENEIVLALAIQSDGRIVAAGTSTTPPLEGYASDFALARYNTDGSLDTTFGDHGRVLSDFGSSADLLWSLALQPDGRIVVAGGAYTGSSLDFAVARYDTDGNLDPTFGGDGHVTTDFFGDYDRAHAVAIQPDGRIVAGGMSWSGIEYRFTLARYSPDGTLDGDFGCGGKVSDLPGVVYDVALQSDGMIVAAGSGYRTVFNGDFALARYDTHGVLDTTFGDSGRALTDFFGNNEAAQAMAILPDDSIVAIGFAVPPGTAFLFADFALACYTRDGQPDTTYLGEGKVTTDFGGHSDLGLNVAVQPDGKIVAIGYSAQGFGSWALARYRSTGSAQARTDPPGHPESSHCHTSTGVDLNVLFGVSDQFVDGPCRTVTAGMPSRSLALWVVHEEYEVVPPGYVPAAATPLEDFVAKLEAVKVVVDGGTRRESTVTFSPAAALRTDLTLFQYAPEEVPYPMAATIPRLGPLRVGEHTVKLIWVLRDMHCDGFGEDPAYNCLPAGEVSFGVRRFTVSPP